MVGRSQQIEIVKHPENLVVIYYSVNG